MNSRVDGSNVRLGRLMWNGNTLHFKLSVFRWMRCLRLREKRQQK